MNQITDGNQREAAHERAEFIQKDVDNFENEKFNIAHNMMLDEQKNEMSKQVQSHSMMKMIMLSCKMSLGFFLQVEGYKTFNANVKKVDHSEDNRRDYSFEREQKSLMNAAYKNARSQIDNRRINMRHAYQDIKDQVCKAIC